MANTIASQVQELYVGYLGRAAEKAGLDYWVNQVSTGKATIQAVAQAFTVSTEYTTAYANLTTAALVAKVYQNVLGRAGEAGGLAYWEAQITSGKITAGQLVNTMLNNLGSIDQATINNKVFVAQTYTDAAGASYNVAAGTSVIAKVDGTPASVTAAIGAITNGTLAGQVPGQALIAAQQAAKAAIVAYEKEVATANATLDRDKNGSATKGEVDFVKGTLVAERDLASKAGDAVATTKTTAELIVAAATAKATLETAKAAVTATPAGVTAVAAYDAAVAGKVSAADVNANNALKAAAVAGLDGSFAAGNAVWTALDSKIATDAAISDAATLYAALTNPAVTAGDRALLVAEVNAKAGTYGTQLVAAADKAIAIAKADTAIATAKAAVVAASDSAKADAYANAVTNNAVAADTLTKTQAADAKVAAVDAILTKFAALEKADADAGTAVKTFSDIATDKITIHDMQGVGFDGVTAATATQSDVFYFSAGKAFAGNDLTIGGAPANSFAAGDSIVLGSGYTFNGGALTTGSNSVLEFFLVKTATGTNIVIETEVYGSASTVADAAGAIAVGGSPDAAVITLTGVSIDHLSVANGVISYV